MNSVPIHLSGSMVLSCNDEGVTSKDTATSMRASMQSIPSTDNCDAKEQNCVFNNSSIFFPWVVLVIIQCFLLRPLLESFAMAATYSKRIKTNSKLAFRKAQC